ncbi:MAG: hypothetical protein HY475_01395 [Candidatus Terrybacteria bacterium]|nr:hypothetical protein [Candidatus Terrybacteria bacterium]
MFESVRQLLFLARKTDKIWLIPVILLLIIVALLVVGAQISPLPVFLYPLL